MVMTFKLKQEQKEGASTTGTNTKLLVSLATLMMVCSTCRSGTRISAVSDALTTRIGEVLERLKDAVTINTIIQVTVPVVFTGALSYMQYTSTQSREDMYRRESYKEQLAQRSHKIAEIYLKEEDYYQAQKYYLAAYEQYLELYQSHATKDWLNDLTVLQYQRALCLANMLNDKYYTECLQILNNILEHQPAHVKALNLRGLLYYIKDKHALAATDFKQSLVLYPEQNVINILKHCSQSRISINKDNMLEKGKEESQVELCRYLENYQQLKGTLPVFTPYLIEVYAEINRRLAKLPEAIGFCQLWRKLYGKNHALQTRLPHVCEQLSCCCDKLSQQMSEKGARSTVTIPSYDDSEHQSFTKQQVLTLKKQSEQEKNRINQYEINDEQIPAAAATRQPIGRP